METLGFTEDANGSGDAVRSADGSPTLHRPGRNRHGMRTQWHLELKGVPRGRPLLFVANELLDAMPVYQFQYQSDMNGWCERLVDVDFSEDGPHFFRFVLSPGSTPAAHAFLSPRQTLAGEGQAPLVIPENMAAQSDVRHSMGEYTPQDGDRVEVCGAALALAEEMGKRLAEDGGAALLVDYGEDGTLSETLQGVKDHEFINVLQGVCV